METKLVRWLDDEFNDLTSRGASLSTIPKERRGWWISGLVYKYARLSLGDENDVIPQIAAVTNLDDAVVEQIIAGDEQPGDEEYRLVEQCMNHFWSVAKLTVSDYADELLAELEVSAGDLRSPLFDRVVEYETATGNRLTVNQLVHGSSVLRDDVAALLVNTRATTVGLQAKPILTSYLQMLWAKARFVYAKTKDKRPYWIALRDE